MSSCECFKLLNGKSIPSIGFGTFKITDENECKNSVINAVKLGYTHIDTAAVYGNEVPVGKGIAECGVDRKDLFVTSKVWNTERGYDKTLKACEETLKRLNLEYLDLYLIHWPAVSSKYQNFNELNADSWKAMVKLYKDGLVKSIGVSNFTCPHLKPLLDSEVTPMVNQIEYHPGYTQTETVKLCQENGIIVEAWSPLGRGKLTEAKELLDIAQKYGKSAAQICIRFCLQNKVVALVKSTHKERMAQNLNVDDFVICDEDMATLSAIGNNLGWSGLDPEKIEFA